MHAVKLRTIRIYTPDAVWAKMLSAPHGALARLPSQEQYHNKHGMVHHSGQTKFVVQFCSFQFKVVCRCSGKTPKYAFHPVFQRFSLNVAIENEIVKINGFLDIRQLLGPKLTPRGYIVFISRHHHDYHH